MARCISFVRSSRQDTAAWARCARHAGPDDVFCTVHRDAINGVMENCIELIRTLPNLVRDPARIEDIEKMDGDDPADAVTGPAASDTGPVDRVEIEAEAVVPSHSGRAARGFVARVHRSGTPESGNAQATHAATTSQAETHVFSDHRDLVNFLGTELAKGQ